MHSSRDGDKSIVKLQHQSRVFPIMFSPWISGAKNRLEWDLKLSDDIPLGLVVKSGANETRLNLTDLQVKNLQVETGASATGIHLSDCTPLSKISIKAGAASVKINVPDNISAKIRVTGGLMDASVDKERFPKRGGFYQSPDYDSADFKADIRINIGVGSVVVR